VQADYSVECGSGDEVLEIPWSSPVGGTSYIDLKQHPEMLDTIPEAAKNPPLRDFLGKINARSKLRTAKCDVWFTRELKPEEDVFQAAGKFGSYVDVLFTDAVARSSLEGNERLAAELVRLLQRAPEIQAAVELCVRRCYMHEPPGSPESSDGFYLTAYVFGYDDEEETARKHWAIALHLMQNAILQLAR
jgi:hypothetical protein